MMNTSTSDYVNKLEIDISGKVTIKASMYKIPLLSEASVHKIRILTPSVTDSQGLFLNPINIDNITLLVRAFLPTPSPAHLPLTMWYIAAE